MNSSSRINIPSHLSSLARLEKFSLQDQTLFLLKRLTLRFPRGKTFTLATLRGPLYGPFYPSYTDPDKLVPGLPITNVGGLYKSFLINSGIRMGDWVTSLKRPSSVIGISSGMRFPLRAGQWPIALSFA